MASLIANTRNGGSLWVGDFGDAVNWLISDPDPNKERMCVLENAGIGADDWLMYPIKDDYNHVKTEWIEIAVDKITERLDAGKKLLVHCAAGIERSPLTCAYWLRKMGVHSTLAAAYTHLRIIRPAVQDRTHWLDFDKRLP